MSKGRLSAFTVLKKGQGFDRLSPSGDCGIDISHESEGRLDRPPSPDRLAVLDEAFGTRFLLFVDTEEEFDWNRPLRRDATATTAIAALPEAHRRFHECGFAPTYLVDYPVADTPQAAAALRPLAEAGECTIGAQLHPWVNPPFEEELTSANSFAGNLPMAIERAKLRALTERITGAIGVLPVVYRAGRYGVGPNSAALLEESGYRLDVSARPLFDYRAEGGPDFSRHPLRPWWVGERLLTLPLTVALTGSVRSAALFAATEGLPLARGALARLGIANRVPLTPEGVPLKEALEAIRMLAGDGLRAFSLSFHSSSLVPGHTPYVRDANDLDRFWRWWDGVLGLFATLGVTPATPEELIAAALA